LRPELYRRLQERFGKVKVHHRGLAPRYALVPSSIPLRQQWSLQEWGETYAICCPHCGDHYFRLYLSHVWGKYDPRTGSRNLGLVFCQNEGCLQERWAQQSLHDHIWSGFTIEGLDVCHAGTARQEADGDPTRLPGLVWPLQKFPLTQAAPAYLLSRHFDPAWLGTYLGVGVLVDPLKEYGWLAGRIIIPVHQHGQRVGWQARLVGEASSKGPPKYYTVPDMPRRRLLYNFDTARQQPYVCVTEGATKVWRYGPEAVATFGKIVTPEQAELIGATWKQVIVLLDPDAKQHTAALLARLRRSCRAVEVDTPDGKSPDDVPTEILRPWVKEAAARQGIYLP
jgi:hypothetical protein